MYGVAYNEFWELNPKSLQPFVRAFELKTKHVDMLMWSHGKYVQFAVASVLSEKAKYPELPFSESAAIDKQEQIKQKFLQKMQAINANIKKEV